MVFHIRINFLYQKGGSPGFNTVFDILVHFTIYHASISITIFLPGCSKLKLMQQLHKEFSNIQ